MRSKERRLKSQSLDELACIDGTEYIVNDALLLKIFVIMLVECFKQLGGDALTSVAPFLCGYVETSQFPSKSDSLGT